MHSLFNRFNSVLTYALNTFLVVTICLAIWPLLQQETTINVKINSSNETVIKNRHYAIVKFDLQANLSAAFNWNIKELWVFFFLNNNKIPYFIVSAQNVMIIGSISFRFIYLNAEYISNDAIETVIWDKIIRRGQDYVVDIRNEYGKYKLDDLANVCSKNLTLKFHWNTIPNIGILHWRTIRESDSLSLQFPNKYCP